MPGKGDTFAKRFQSGEETQFAGVECSLQGFQEEAPEQSRQDPDGQEETRWAGNPALAIGGQSATGRHTVQMRMK